MRWTPSQEVALGLEAKKTEATGQWGPCVDARKRPRQGVTLAVAIKAHDMVELHRVLARPSKEITQKTAQAMGITTTDQWGPCEALLLVKAKRQAVGSIDGPHKTGSKGFGDDNLGVKPGEDKSVWRRDYLQLEAWELDLEQQPTSQKRKKKIEEAPSDPKEGTQEVRPDPAEEIRQAL